MRRCIRSDKPLASEMRMYTHCDSWNLLWALNSHFVQYAVVSVRRLPQSFDLRYTLRRLKHFIAVRRVRLRHTTTVRECWKSCSIVVGIRVPSQSLFLIIVYRRPGCVLILRYEEAFRIVTGRLCLQCRDLTRSWIPHSARGIASRCWLHRRWHIRSEAATLSTLRSCG